LPRGRFELIFGLGAIALCGVLAWSISHYRDFQAAYYRQQFVRAPRNDCDQYLEKLAELGPAGERQLSRVLVTPDQLAWEDFWERHGDWAKHVQRLSNQLPRRVCVIWFWDRQDATEFKTSPRSWLAKNLRFSTVLESGEKLPMEARPEPVLPDFP
jgi:hypothetical protein